jgi:hypothetical protein
LVTIACKEAWSIRLSANDNAGALDPDIVGAVDI